MPKRGKKYQEAVKLIDPAVNYSPEDAVDLVKKTSYAKFDATIEAHLRMGVDPRKADQQIRTTVQLPHGTGKVVRILVFAEGEDQKRALDAGADYAGTDEYIQLWDLYATEPHKEFMRLNAKQQNIEDFVKGIRKIRNGTQ